MQKLRRVPLVVLFVLVSRCQVLADVGTPLMWAGLLHLVFGNALIGVAEGLAISWLFSVRKLRAILIMILANYFSAWLGLAFVSTMSAMLPLNLNTAWRWFWIMAAASYVLTLIFEWPFVAWCFQRSQGWFRQSIRASVFVQTGSYLVIFGWYWLASDFGIYTKMKVVPADQLVLPPQLVVYFISSTDGNVYRRAPFLGREEKVVELHSKSNGDRLWFEPNPTKTNVWDLGVEFETSKIVRPQSKALMRDVAAEAGPVIIPSDDNERSWMGPGRQAPRLGTATNSDWIICAEYWNNKIKCYNRRDQTVVDLGFETPIAFWAARNPYLLPGDLVLFQFGRDQICLFSPGERKLALLWPGRGAVPIMMKR